MGLVAMNLVMVLLVFLPPKRSTVRGVVVFRGVPPVVSSYDLMHLDPACAAALGSRVFAPEWKLSTNRARPELAAALSSSPTNATRAGLAGAVVRIVSPVQSADSDGVATNVGIVEIHDCQMTPRRLVVWTNQPVELCNSATTPQTMEIAGPGVSAPKTIPLASGQRSERLSLAAAGQFVTVSPRGRPWLRTDIVALAPQPFAVSDEDGVFEFRGRIPNEGATLELLHPQAGRKTFRLTKDALRALIVLEIGTE